MMKTVCSDHPRAGENIKNAIAIALVYAVALLIALGWSEESWGQMKLPRVGILTLWETSDEARMQWLEPFRRALAGQGWVEGRHVAFEYRGGVGDLAQLAAAADLVRLKVDVIFADGAPFVRAVSGATRTIPIVAVDYTSDPVAAGYAKSYSRPGGNVTGVFLDAPDFSGKWIELLKAIVPDLSRVAVLWDPSPGAAHLNAVKRLAGWNGLKIQVIEVRTPDDIDRAFSAFHGRPQALIALPSPMMFLESERLAALALRHRLPSTSMARQFSDAGGLVAYGPDGFQADERAAGLVAKILAGANPGDLPVEGPSKFNLVVNLKTAKALGLPIPQSILVRADEVIR